MKNPRRIRLAMPSALTLGTAVLFATVCKPKVEAATPPSNAAVEASTPSPAKKSGPEPFTARLTELDDVQVIYSFRHPKLILADLDALMNAVPEAGLLRMVLPKLTPYGYPEFSELDPAANIGVALLKLDPAELKSDNPPLVAFAKLKEGGKIWNALTQAGMTLQKNEAWTWIAKDPAVFAKIKNFAAVSTYLERPQSAELAAWGRTSPELLAKGKELLIPQLQGKMAKLPADEQKAVLAYTDVLWSYLAQIHSLEGSLDLNAQGIVLSNSGQFLPESKTGAFLRYTPGPAPAIAASLPADGLMNIAMRQNMPAQIEFVSGLLDDLIAVDYPAGAEPLKALKASYLALSEHSDGGAALSMDITLPADGQPPVMDLIGVQSGDFTTAQVNALYGATAGFAEKFNGAIFNSLALLSPRVPVPAIKQTLKENVLTIDGISFGSFTTTTTIADQENVQTQYHGVVGGNLVYAMSETALREKVPALAAKKTVADAIPADFQGDEIIIGTIPGGKIVDMVTKNLPLNLDDADVQARITSLKTAYAAGGPVKLTLGASQARATAVISIPYSFIAQSVQLGQFANANKPAPSPAPSPATPPATP